MSYTIDLGVGTGAVGVETGAGDTGFTASLGAEAEDAGFRLVSTLCSR